MSNLPRQLCKSFFTDNSTAPPYLGRLTRGHPKNILDIATSNRIWAIHFAGLYTQANILSTDISHIQPEGPRNCSRVKGNAENQEWTLPTPLDHYHMWLVLVCFDDHRMVMCKTFDRLQPGGWLEMMDPTFEIL